MVRILVLKYVCAFVFLYNIFQRLFLIQIYHKQIILESKYWWIEYIFSLTVCWKLTPAIQMLREVLFGVVNI